MSRTGRRSPCRAPLRSPRAIVERTATGVSVRRRASAYRHDEQPRKREQPLAVALRWIGSVDRLAVGAKKAAAFGLIEIVEVRSETCPLDPFDDGRRVGHHMLVR